MIRAPVAAPYRPASVACPTGIPYTPIAIASATASDVTAAHCAFHLSPPRSRSSVSRGTRATSPESHNDPVGVRSCRYIGHSLEVARNGALDQGAGHPRPDGKAEEGVAPGLCGDRRQ